MTSRPNLDRLTEHLSRTLASGLSRRMVFARLAAVVGAAPLLPLLPVSKAHAEPQTAFTRNAQSKDPKKCDYWRYCAIDGVLCSCCGGGVHTCPPGTTPSPTAWIGTCINPDDQRAYLVAYRDCCGALSCRASAKCNCDSTDRETPAYRPQTDNDIIWCIGLSTMNYHCSTAVLVGVAE